MLRNAQYLLNNLPDDVVNSLVTNYLDLKTIKAIKCVSSDSNRFFSDHPSYWVKKVAQDFNFSEEELLALPLRKNTTALQLGHRVFSSLPLLDKKLHQFKKATKYFFKDKINQFLIFICCTDDLPSFLEATNPGDLNAFYELSLYLGCVNIPKYIYTLCCDEISKMSNHNILNSYKLETLVNTVPIGRLDIVHFLFESEHKIDKPGDEILIEAAQSGVVELIDYFIQVHQLKICNIRTSYAHKEESTEKDDKKEDEQPDINPLNHAAMLGHLNAFKHLLSLGASIDEQTIHSAAKSGSAELVKYLVDVYKQIPTQETLENAIISGNRDLCDFLTAGKFPNIDSKLVSDSVYVKSTNPAFQFSQLAPVVKRSTLQWRQEHLGNVVAASGNLELLKIALEPMPFFLGHMRVFPSQLTLSYAALSGNIEMVKHLLNLPYNSIKLKPNDETLYCAIQSQNMSLVSFLLNPSNRFYTECSDVLISQQTTNAVGLLLFSHRHFLGALMTLKNLITSEQETRSTIGEQFAGEQITVESIIRDTFTRSFHNSSEHCAEMFKDVLLNPSYYDLNKNMVVFSQKEFKSILEKMNMSLNESSAPFIKKIVLTSIKWLEENETNIVAARNKLDNNNYISASFKN